MSRAFKKNNYYFLTAAAFYVIFEASGNSFSDFHVFLINKSIPTWTLFLYFFSAESIESYHILYCLHTVMCKWTEEAGSFTFIALIQRIPIPVLHIAK